MLVTHGLVSAPGLKVYTFFNLHKTWEAVGTRGLWCLGLGLDNNFAIWKFQFLGIADESMTKLCTVLLKITSYETTALSFVVVENTWKYFCYNVYHETAIACFLWQQKHSRDSSRLVINYPDQSSSQSFQTGAGDRTGSGSVRPNKYCYWLTYNGQGYSKKGYLNCSWQRQD